MEDAQATWTTMTGPCPHCGVNASEVMPLVVKLRLQRDELLAALEAVEWRKDHDYLTNRCPACRNVEKWGHAPDCQLAAAIKAAKGE